jgi:hypothetical protein
MYSNLKKDKRHLKGKTYLILLACAVYVFQQILVTTKQNEDK